MVNFNYRVFEGKAEKIEIPLQGHEIQAGKSKKRIDIDGFKIAGRVIKESGNSLKDGVVRFFGTISGRYVEVKGKGGEILLLNVSSLSKRILLDKNTIKESADSGQLESKIESKIKELNLIISNYKEAEILSKEAEILSKKAEILSYIHSEGTCIGIEDKPSSVIQAPIDEAKIQKDGNYEDLLMSKLSLKTGLLHALQLLAGGKVLADKNILQGDIKPDNILVKGLYVKIADFRGACKADEEEDLKRIFHIGGSRTFTPVYLNLYDVMEGEYLVDENNKEELVRLEKKGDAFSLGIILYQAFTGTYPFSKFTQFDTPDTNSYKGFLGHPDIPKEVQDIVGKLLIDDYVDRSSCEEAFFSLLKYVQENHPDVAEEFKEMMKGYVEIKP